MTPNTIVFLGPSLPREAAAEILDARYLPPVARGDIYRWIPSGAKRMVIIDGVFHQTPSVWHRELLAAIDEGIEVWGASSMGALRAAELAELGMRGHGQVFDWYRTGKIDGDDEVAVMHREARGQYVPLSTPLVTVRNALNAAHSTERFSEQRLVDILAAAQQLFFGDRTWETIFAGLDEADDGLRAFLEAVPDVKASDAASLLALCARTEPVCEPRSSIDALDPPPWELAGVHVGAKVQEAASLLAEMGAHEPSSAATAQQEARRDWYLLDWARTHGIECPDDELARRRAEWIAARPSPPDAAWLRESGLTAQRFESLLREHLTVQWLLDRGPAHFGRAWLDPLACVKRTQLSGALRDWARRPQERSDD